MNFLSERIHHIDTSEIRRVFDLAKKIKNVKDLSIGQPDFPVPQAVKEELIKAIRENKNAYSQTQGILPLREALSKKYHSRGISISPENIVISTGVASVLFLLFQTIFNKKDKILLIDPYFLIYQSLVDYHQLNAFYLPENFSREDIDQLITQNNIDGLKAIVFASPSNPTGKILSREQISLLGQLAEKNNALLISDEIYEAFDYDGLFMHTASLFPKRTLTLSGFSKSYAMTGLRVGYLAAPLSLSMVVEKIAALQQHSIVCSPQPAQWAALKALDTPISKEIELMKGRREIVFKALEGVVSFSSHPDGAFYVFPIIPQNSKEFTRRAIERELLIVPGYIFSRNQNTVRISYAQNETILKEGLKIFCELIKDKKNE